MMNVLTIAASSLLTSWPAFWEPVVYGIVILAITVGVILLILNKTRVGAVARMTWSQAWRMKVVLVVALFLLVAVPLMPMLLETDDTMTGQIKIALTYSVYLAMFLLSVMTIFLSTSVICKEVEGRQIFVLDTKPVARWQIFLGKWLGVMLVNLVLTTLLCVACVVGLFVMLWTGHITSPRDAVDMKFHFMVARGVKAPTLEYVPVEEAKKLAEEWKKDGRLPVNRNEKWVIRHMTTIVQRQRNSVRPMAQGVWRFEGLPTNLSESTPLQFRFKHFVTNRPEDSKVRGIWMFGADRERLYIKDLRATVDVYNEFDVPAGTIAQDGSLLVRFWNRESDAPMTIFPLEEGLQVFYPKTTIFENFGRSFSVILYMLGFLAILGLTAGAFLSYPVAILVAVSLFMLGISAGFLGDNIEGAYFFGPDSRQPGAAFHPGDKIIQGTLKTVMFVLSPKLMHYSPVRYLADASVVPDEIITGALFKLLLLRGGIIALIGMFLFHRREFGTAATQ